MLTCTRCLACRCWRCRGTSCRQTTSRTCASRWRASARHAAGLWPSRFGNRLHAILAAAAPHNLNLSRPSCTRLPSAQVPFVRIDRAHTWENDGLETGIMEAAAARMAWICVARTSYIIAPHSSTVQLVQAAHRGTEYWGLHTITNDLFAYNNKPPGIFCLRSFSKHKHKQTENVFNFCSGAMGVSRSGNRSCTAVMKTVVNPMRGEHAGC